MPRRLTVVVSQGQSASPQKRALEEDLVGALLMERGIEVTVVPNLYDLPPDGTGMLCLRGIQGDMVVLAWLFPRAAHWTLDRNGIRGRIGVTLLKAGEEEQDDEDEEAADEADKAAAGDSAEGDKRADVPARNIYCLDLRAHAAAAPYVEEVRRIANEATVQTVDLLGWIGGSPQPAQLQRFLTPASGNVASSDVDSGNAATGNGQAAETNGHAAGSLPAISASVVASAAIPTTDSAAAAPAVLRIEEETPRRWYPVIDYTRCTNCMECLDFCLFGVYGVGQADSILVEQPDNCRKGCPACSRVCPENAIIFPQHKTPAIAGSPEGAAGGFKIDLSRLFGAPDALEQAALERDVELVAVGRDAVGMDVGMPKRQDNRSDAPKDDLDSLMDQLDDLEL